ncbi:hypothetical protein F5877DRAFT_86990 [Lentinula edodes]|nr:hypothetical protein F5877DRAFT_86990 [Lentinula edodes]
MSGSSVSSSPSISWCSQMSSPSHFFFETVLTGRELIPIVMQRLIKIDGKVRTYPAGFMDVVSIENPFPSLIRRRRSICHSPYTSRGGYI